MPRPRAAGLSLLVQQQGVRHCHGVQVTCADQRHYGHGAHRSIEAPTFKICHRLGFVDGIAKPTPERSNPHIETGILGRNFRGRTIAAVQRDASPGFAANLATAPGRALANMTYRVTTEGNV